MTKNLNMKFALIVLITITILIWWIILRMHNITARSPNWKAITEVPAAVGWATPVAWWFIRHGWKMRCLSRWLVKIPNLNGTWEGEFRSEWIDPATNEKIPQKKALLVIKQTLFTIHCKFMTAESESYSSTATVIPALFNDPTIVEFLYKNSPRVSVQNRSINHDGACSLKLIEKPKLSLTGKYWTDRNTKGELDFTFQSREMKEQFCV